MAAKKASTTKDATKKPKASTKKAGVKKTAVKKAAPKKAGKVSSETASKSGTPKAAAKGSAVKKAAVKKAAPKKAAIKLNDKQLEILKKVHAAGDAGYASGVKVEDRTLEALLTRKFLKKGAKNKETGKVHYSLTSAGKKHLSTTPTETPSPTTPTT